MRQSRSVRTHTHACVPRSYALSSADSMTAPSPAAAPAVPANPFQSAAASASAHAASAVAASPANSADDDDDDGEDADEEDVPLRVMRAELAAAAASSSSPRSSRPSAPASAPVQPALSPQDVNTATAARIAAALPKTSKLTAVIIAERDACAFTSWADMEKRVKGLGPAKVKALQRAGLFINDAQQSQAQVQAQIATGPASSQPLQPQQQAGDDSQPQQPVPAPAAPFIVYGVTTNAAASSELPTTAPLLPSEDSSSASAPASSVVSPPAPAVQSMIAEPAAAPAAAATAQPSSASNSCWSGFLCCGCGCNCGDSAPHESTVQPKPAAANVDLAPTVVVQPVAGSSSSVAIDPTLRDIEAKLANMSIAAPPVIPAPFVPPVDPPPLPQPTLRAGCWNLQHFNAAKAAQVDTMSVIAEVIVRQRYDVLVLIEVRSKEACEVLLQQYLNNPARVRPKQGVLEEISAAAAGVGHWRLETSECAEYGSEAQMLPTSACSSPQQVVLDVVEESSSAAGVEVTSTHAVLSTHHHHAAASNDDALVNSMASVTLDEQTVRVGASGDWSMRRTHVESTHVSSSATFTTPVKKRAPSRALSPPPSTPGQQHHRRSSGGSSGSGSGFTPRRTHKKREYYAWLYRSDRVELPFGCRLFQTKASSSQPAAPSAANQDADASAYTWWRSPCYAMVRPLPALLTERPSAPSVPPVSWLLCALHVIWGNGYESILQECSHLQDLYSSLVRLDVAGANSAVALLGDFNFPYDQDEWARYCLPMDCFDSLVKTPPHASTFSGKNPMCNLYDTVFVERSILRTLLPGGKDGSKGPDSAAPLPSLPSGVVYFDALFFPPPDSATLDQVVDARSQAKKLVSDHRPVWADLPATGRVAGIAARAPMKKMQPPPVYVPRAHSPPVADGAGAGSSPEGSPPADGAATSTPVASIASPSAPPLASQLSIIVVTSAIPLHPSTQVIDAVLHSLWLMPELVGVSVYIMCDAPKIVVPDDAADANSDAPAPAAAPASAAAGKDPNIFKRGVITASRFAAYRSYISNLRTRYAPRPEVRIVELEQYAGFGGAVRIALEKYALTDFVLVCQHDYVFTQRVPMLQLVSSMSLSHRPGYLPVPAGSPLAPTSLNYIGFVHKSTIHYMESMCARMHPSLAGDPMRRVYHAPQPGGRKYPAPAPIHLCPLLFWYDKPHLASREFYLSKIFTHPRMIAAAGAGAFVEDEFGVAVLEEIRASPKGMDVWASKLGAYLYNSDARGVHIALRHLHGRRFELQPARGLGKILAPEATGDAGEDDDSDDEPATHALFQSP